MEKTIKITAKFDDLRHEDGYEVVDRIIHSIYDEIRPMGDDGVVEFELVVRNARNITDKFLEGSGMDKFVNYNGVDAVEVKE